MTESVAPNQNSYAARTARAEAHWAASIQALPLEGPVAGRVFRHERFGVFIDSTAARTSTDSRTSPGPGAAATSFVGGAG